MKTEPPWRAVKATGGVTFVEKRGKSGVIEKFALHFDDGDAERLVKLLNRMDKPKPAKTKESA